MSEPITFEDFAKLEIRMGEVVAAEVPEGSEKLIKLTVDFGEPIKTRTIMAGIKQWYKPEELVGKKLPFILNIPFRQMGQLGESQGMLMAVVAKVGEAERPVLLVPEQTVDKGSVIR